MIVSNIRPALDVGINIRQVLKDKSTHYIELYLAIKLQGEFDIKS